MRTPFENTLNQLKNNDKSLTELYLEHDIDDDDVKNLSKALEKNTSLTTLNLYDNNIGPAGTKDLSISLQNNTGLTTLDLRANNIGDAGAKDFSKTLQINTTLTTLDLSGNNIGADGAKDLSAALQINTTLTTLDLSGNKIGDAGLKALSMALENNTSLTTLKLLIEWICVDGVKDLASALKNNYTLLDLDYEFDEGETDYEDDIYLCLDRNKQIASLLSPLYNAIQKGFLFNETIETCLKGLEQLLPNLQELPEDSYPVEAYRLLTALGHIGTLGNNAAERKEAQINALHALLPAFKNPSFQQMADKSLGLLLAADFSMALKEQQLDKEGLLLSLYAFRNLGHLPEINEFSQLALFKLIHSQDKFYGFEEKQAFKDNMLVLSQKQFLSLLEKALESLQGTPDSYETQLLQALFQSKVCYAFTLSTACQSKAFHNAFKSQYPKANSFTTLEHCLLTASQKETSFLMDVSKEPSQVITEDGFAEFALQLIDDDTKSADKMIEEVKQTLEKAFPVALDESEKMIVEEQKDKISDVIQAINKQDTEASKEEKLELLKSAKELSLFSKHRIAGALENEASVKHIEEKEEEINRDASLGI